MTHSTLDALRDLAPAYVMGTLSLEETRVFEQAMADPAVAAELAPEIEAHRAAFDYLAAMQPATPPDALKGRVMQRITAEVTAGSEPAAAPPAPAARPVVSDGGAQAGGRAARGRAGWWSSGVLGVALAAAAVFAVDLRGEMRTLQDQLEAQREMNRVAAGSLAEKERTLAALLDAGNDLTLVRLTASQPEGPDMQVFWNTRAGRGVVRATGLAQLRQDRAYCLWVIQDGTPVAVKLFRVDASGRALIADVVLPAGLTGVAAFAVTEEPASGSPKPTMTPFLVGAVPSS